MCSASFSLIYILCIVCVIQFHSWSFGSLCFSCFCVLVAKRAHFSTPARWVTPCGKQQFSQQDILRILSIAIYLWIRLLRPVAIAWLVSAWHFHQVHFFWNLAFSCMDCMHSFSNIQSYRVTFYSEIHPIDSLMLVLKHGYHRNWVGHMKDVPPFRLDEFMPRKRWVCITTKNTLQERLLTVNLITTSYKRLIWRA